MFCKNLNISNETFCKAIYTSYFGETFHEQINSLYYFDELAEITLSIKEKEIYLAFKNNECIEAKRQHLDIFNTSLYIDDPFVIDELNNNLSFGITIKVSTFSRSLSTPLKAFTILAFASNLNGLVTTPTVRIP